MADKRKWWLQVLIALDQLFNALLGGYADETLSSRSYRGAKLANNPKLKWQISRSVIDSIFFWEENHCQKAYESEVNRRQYPSEFQSL